MTREEIQTALKNYPAQYPTSRIGIFGSFAQREEQKDSDIDILVTFEKPISLCTLLASTDLLKIGFRKLVALRKNSKYL